MSAHQKTRTFDLTCEIEHDHLNPSDAERLLRSNLERLASDPKYNLRFRRSISLALSKG